MYKVTLAGNPNVGKSTIFNILTNDHQHTGNWAGKTVDNACGKYYYNNNYYKIYDIPGTYSLITMSPEEKIAKEFIVKNESDVTVVICNAINLEMSLNLVLQILSITPNVIVVVNLIDEARRRKIKIDLEKLSNLLMTPVIGCSALNKEGIEELKEKIEYQVMNKVVNKNKLISDIKEDTRANKLIEISNYIASNVVEIKDYKHLQKERKIDKILTNKITGIPIMLLLLFIIFWLTIVGSNYPSEFLSSFLFKLEEPLTQLLSFLPDFINSLLVHGVYKTTSWIISVMLPPMLIFFPLFTILEDIGFLPRIAFNLDPVFSKCSSCGKQSLTMCMGIGCNAVGVTGCRIIETKRERLLAILTNCFMPCNGRYPLMIAIISMFFLKSNSNLSSLFCASILVLFILLAILMTFLVNKILSKTLLKGSSQFFILELPNYRRIKIIPLIVRSIFERTLSVLLKSILIAIPFSIIIYIFTNISINGLSIVEYLRLYLDPLGKLIGLDGAILLAFILGQPANEIVLPILLMIYLNTSVLTNYDNLISLKNILLSNCWSIKTSICFLIFTLFHFPCSTTLLCIKKETNSNAWTLFSYFLPLIVGIILCLIVNFFFYLFS